MAIFPYPTGAIPSPRDPRDFPVAMRLAAADPVLAAAERLSGMPVVTEQQGGTCVPHAAAGDAGFSEIHELGGTVRFDAETWYDELRAQQGLTGPDGLVVRDTLMSWRELGPPVVGGHGDRRHTRIDSFYAVPPTLVGVKQAIHQTRHPVLLVSAIATAWGDTTSSGQLAPIDTYQPEDQWTGAFHLWLAWGWDDRATLGLLIRSSWGLTFGKNGNCYMTPDQFAASAVEAWSVQSAT